MSRLRGRFWPVFDRASSALYLYYYCYISPTKCFPPKWKMPNTPTRRSWFSLPSSVKGLTSFSSSEPNSSRDFRFFRHGVEDYERRRQFSIRDIEHHSYFFFFYGLSIFYLVIILFKPWLVFYRRFVVIILVFEYHVNHVILWSTC